jgi:hypothetical protein
MEEKNIYADCLSCGAVGKKFIWIDCKECLGDGFIKKDTDLIICEICIGKGGKFIEAGDCHRCDGRGFHILIISNCVHAD